MQEKNYKAITPAFSKPEPRHSPEKDITVLPFKRQATLPA